MVVATLTRHDAAFFVDQYFHNALLVELDPQFTRRPKTTGVNIWRSNTFVSCKFRTRIFHDFHHARAGDNRFLASHCITHAEMLTNTET